MPDRRKDIEERIREIDRDFNKPWSDAWCLAKERSRLIAELTRLTAESAGLARERGHGR